MPSRRFRGLQFFVGQQNVLFLVLRRVILFRKHEVPFNLSFETFLVIQKISVPRDVAKMDGRVFECSA